MKFKNVITPLSFEDFQDLIEKRPPYKLWQPTLSLTSLFGWAELNTILRQQRTNVIDISILRHSRRVPVEDTAEKVDRKFRRINQLNSEKLAGVLRSGGTVRISRIDEKSDKLNLLATDIENLFGCEVTMSLYAGFGSTHHALPAHFDRHDVLVIQFEGNKTWEIFGFGSDSYPIKPSEEILAECPSKPIWSGQLEKGNLLFIPRGSWHRASVISNVPTLQVSIAFHHIMLYKLHDWLASKLSNYPINGKHLLYWNVGDDLLFENEIWKALGEILKPGFIDKYRRDSKLLLSRRFNMNLPDMGA